jgi:hypothetical protein
MSGKRRAARQWSAADGTIDDSGVVQVLAALRDAVEVEQEPLPDLEGQATIVGPPGNRSLPALKKKVSGGAPLLPADDVRAMLKRAIITLGGRKFRRHAEIRYLTLALRRHLELGLTLDQAFGYARFGKGAPPSDPDRARQIACAVFEERFINGRNAETAGIEAGKKYGITKTPALDAFASHDGYALQFFRAQRMAKGRTQLWSREEERRLKRYYGARQKQLKDWLDSQPE